MIDQISGIPRVEEESLYAEKTTDSLGRDEFLKLFLTQMNYQDPLNPMDSQQFSAQLAQFSTLEQLYNVNDNLESMGASQSQSSRYQALNFIGKEVLAKGDSLSLGQDHNGSGAFTLMGTADCTISVLDSQGVCIKEIRLGVLEAGQHDFDWDGTNQNGILQEPGTYRFEVSAADSGGAAVPVDTLLKGEVSRVNLEGNDPVLYVGDLPLSLSQVVDIRHTQDALATGGDETL